MNRAKIKKEARELLKGNVWTIIKPFLVVALISGLVSGLIGGSAFNGEEINPTASTLLSIVEIAMYPLTFGCVVYVLKFVRKEEVNINILFQQYKKFWPIFAMYFLVGLFTGLWALLLVVPGIIAAISYTMAPYIMADGEEDSMECIRKSKAMMNGYKWDYFVFNLSFILWILLGCVTFGLAFIYVGPYMTVAQTLYYEELREVNPPKGE